ncbi:MAG TPA: hypothetical protein VIM12_15560 [Noviherbaspirillum sp.]|jgi:hypothetical protein
MELPVLSASAELNSENEETHAKFEGNPGFGAKQRKIIFPQLGHNPDP